MILSAVGGLFNWTLHILNTKHDATEYNTCYYRLDTQKLDYYKYYGVYKQLSK